MFRCLLTITGSAPLPVSQHGGAELIPQDRTTVVRRYSMPIALTFEGRDVCCHAVSAFALSSPASTLTSELMSFMKVSVRRVVLVQVQLAHFLTMLHERLA